jgi:TonB family protein
MGQDKTWPVESVDVPVEAIEQPPVRYPPALAQADIAGLVELEYVVDTAGRAEPGSVRALAAAHPEFEAAARAAVLASRFRPARLHGQAVRQLVRQTFRFRSER